ncbi:type II toxin-antitoxin system Phd/YefM family antitoxin [candidate division KSB1 bacterium]|nr:type II toxin-antitoxin system Phd/YefM family antitoxin [candidate division KSB1 bacterium]
MLEFLQKNTITVAELQAKADKIITKTKRSGQPFLIIQNGKPTALLLDVKAFFEELAVENLARQIALGEADIAAGRVQDLDEVLQEIHNDRKLSRSRRKARKG